MSYIIATTSLPKQLQFGRHPKKSSILFNTTACIAASTSLFVFASITLTLMKHEPAGNPNTLASVGRRVVPHLLTSGGVLELAVVTLVRTNVKLDGVGQTVEDVDGRLTLSVTLVGRIGREGD